MKHLRALVFALPWLAGCGGGVPLLHPAHPLRVGAVSAGVGASGHFVTGAADSAIDEANAVDPALAGGDAIARGVAADVLGAPGLAPFVAARVGVAERTEAGLAYTGRSLRIDGRHALTFGSLALSGGLGLRGILSHPTANPDRDASGSGALARADTGAISGFGVDVPVVFGYRSDAELVQLWGGLRGTFEQASGEVLFAGTTESPEDDTSTDFDGRAFTVEGLVGLAVGLPPLWVAAELSVGYLNARGELTPEGGTGDVESVDGLTITPGGALIGRF